MATVTRNNMNNFLEPILFTVWDNEYKRLEKLFPKVFNMNSSSKNKETIAGLTGFNYFAGKLEGQPITSDAYYQAAKTEITMHTYASMFSVTREQIEDAQYAEAKKNAQDLAFAAKETQEVLAWSVFNNAFDAGYTGGDGKELIATDHPLYGPTGGTESNEVAAATDLTVTSLQEVITILEDTRDDRGLRLALKGNKLIVPSAGKFIAGEILTSTLKPYTANNERNVIQDEGLQLMVVPYLTDTDCFYVVCDKHGLMWFDRRPVDFGADNVFETEDLKYKSTFRCGYGWADWRGIAGSPGV